MFKNKKKERTTKKSGRGDKPVARSLGLTQSNRNRGTWEGNIEKIHGLPQGRRGVQDKAISTNPSAIKRKKHWEKALEEIRKESYQRKKNPEKGSHTEVRKGKGPRRRRTTTRKKSLPREESTLIRKSPKKIPGRGGEKRGGSRRRREAAYHLH